MSTLRELARKGRDRQEQRRDQEDLAENSARVAEAASRRQTIQLAVGRSLTRWAFLGLVFGNTMVVLFLLAGGGLVAALAPSVGASGLTFWAAVVVVGLTCSLPLPARWYVHSLLQREIAWIHALPFQLIGYPDLLGWKSYPSVTIALHFEHPPNTTLLTQALSEAGLPVTLEEVAGLRVEIEVENPKGSKFDGQRRWFRRWLHQVEPALRALHQEFGLVSIYFYPSVTERKTGSPMSFARWAQAAPRLMPRRRLLELLAARTTPARQSVDPPTSSRTHRPGQCPGPPNP